MYRNISIYYKYAKKQKIIFKIILMHKTFMFTGLFPSERMYTENRRIFI